MGHIISASRRTDIPAFYSEWLMNRLRAGFCLVPNPVNREQVSRISLSRRDVAAIVFWTRDPRPLLRCFPEIDAMGHRYYFQFTLNAYPRELEPHAPSLHEAVGAFASLSGTIGAHRCLWRYDPVILTSLTDTDYHRRRLDQLFAQLSGLTDRLTVSVVDFYRKSEQRLKQLESRGVRLLPYSEKLETYLPVLRHAAELAKAHGVEIVSCAEPPVMGPLGIRPGRCIDDAVIARAFGITVPAKKDPGQRDECGCIVSRDIGAYDTCLHGCEYCYATSSNLAARRRRRQHDPASPSLIGMTGADASIRSHGSQGTPSLFEE
jgi:DNA repair photolyase